MALVFYSGLIRVTKIASGVDSVLISHIFASGVDPGQRGAPVLAQVQPSGAAERITATPAGRPGHGALRLPPRRPVGVPGGRCACAHGPCRAVAPAPRRRPGRTASPRRPRTVVGP